MTEQDLKQQDLKREHEALKEENERLRFSNSLLEKELQQYRDLEEQGLLLKLPCKVGDSVYQIPSKVNFDLNAMFGHEENNRVYHQKVSRVVLGDRCWHLVCDKDEEYGTGRICVDKFFGETWFLSKEEAEAKLKELGDK